MNFLHVRSLPAKRWSLPIIACVISLLIVGRTAVSSLALNLSYIEYAQERFAETSDSWRQTVPRSALWLDRFDDYLLVRILLARLAEQQGQYSEVIEHLASPFDASAHVIALTLLNDAYAAQGQFEMIRVPDNLLVGTECSHGERSQLAPCLLQARAAAARQDWDLAANLYRQALIASITSSGEIPEGLRREWRWLEVRCYSAKKATGGLQPREAYLLALNQAKLGLWAEVDSLVQEIAESYEFAREIGADRMARILYWWGRAREELGDPGSASQLYERGTKLLPWLPELYQRLWLHYQTESQTLKAETLREALDNKKPLVEVGVPVGSWMLEGYDVDPWEVESSPLLDITLYWSPLEAGSVPGAEWLAAGKHWLERREVINLIANPDFGLGSVTSGWEAVPYWHSMYRESVSDQVQLRDFSSPGIRFQAVCLTNSEPLVRVGLRSARVPVVSGQRLLFSGEVTSTAGAIPFMGLQWWDREFRIVGSGQAASDYPASTTWQFRSAVIQVPKQAHYVWALVGQPPSSRGTVCFDNLLLVSLQGFR